MDDQNARQCPLHKHEMGLTQLPQDPKNASCTLARVQNGGDGHKFSNWKSFGCQIAVRDGLGHLITSADNGRCYMGMN